MRVRKQRVEASPVIAPALQPPKLQVIDFAVERLGARSFADLGGVWAVEAGYTFHVLSRPGIERGVLIDTGVTEGVKARAGTEPRLQIVEADFTDPAVARSVGPVDMVLMFDVLLHQVAPDWDDVLTRWSDHTSAFVIVNPQLRSGDLPVRLIDLGQQEYVLNTPGNHLPVPWDALDEIDPRYGKPARDVHEYWQWGIPDAALHRAMSDLGFRQLFHANHGQWRDVPTFDNVAFVYERTI